MPSFAVKHPRSFSSIISRNKPLNYTPSLFAAESQSQGNSGQKNNKNKENKTQINNFINLLRRKSIGVVHEDDEEDGPEFPMGQFRDKL